MNRVFFEPGLKRYFLLPQLVLETLYAHAQRGPRQTEAGGELFSPDPGSAGIVVTAATGPSRKDKRSRWAFDPDIEEAGRNREQAFQKGLHAVGLWHTHPEPQPHPSLLDRKTTLQYLRGFGGDRQRYLLVTIGNSGDIPKIVVFAAEGDSQSQWVQWTEMNASSRHSDGRERART